VLGDYREVLLNISAILKDNGLNVIDLGNRAALNILAENLQEALDDLDTALQLISTSPTRQINFPETRKMVPHFVAKPRLLRMRGYVKTWMGDYAGARADNEAVGQSQIYVDAGILPPIDYHMVEKLSFYSVGVFLGLLSMRYTPLNAELLINNSPGLGFFSWRYRGSVLSSQSSSNLNEEKIGKKRPGRIVC
jgi:hypothetical protein